MQSTKTEANGSFEFNRVRGSGLKTEIDPATFGAPFTGVSWLGPKLITPSIIFAYVWVWAGFAMVVIGAGLAAISREVLEAARTDGATEWQVFRRITVPMLAPVLSVVFITMLINVLKVFDIIISIAPGSTQSDAAVIAVQMWRQSFGGSQRLRPRLGDRRVPVHPRHPGAAPERAPLPQGGLVVATYELEQTHAPVVVKDPHDTTAARIGRFATRLPLQILLAFIAVLWLLPTLGLFLTSLLSPEDFQTNGWWKVIAHPHLGTWANYSNVWNNTDIPHALVLTAEIAIGGTVLPILIAASAGYAFAWIDFPGRDWLFVGVIALLVVPLQMGLIPIFHLYNTLSIYDTVLGLILFHTAFGLPFAIFLLRNFFIGIPKDILESARIDGASEFRIFWKLILPLGLPAIASLAIFQFLWTWNDLLVALVMARNTQPITVSIFSQLRQFGSNIDIIAPASFMSLIIPLVVFFSFQRYFVQGLLAGSVK